MSFWEALAAVQNWATAAWVRGDPASPSLPTSAHLSQIEAWRGQAWRALTRLRRADRSAH